MKKYALFIGLTFVCSNSFAADLPDVIGKPYEQARSLLNVYGYTPLTREQVQMLPERPDMIGPGESDLISKGFPEVSACTGSGIPMCWLLLKNMDDLIFEAKVYVPEDGGETRVEAFTDSGLMMLPDGKIAPALNVLQERIALTGSYPVPAIFAAPRFKDLEPCNADCAAKTVYKDKQVTLVEFDTYIDPVSGYEIPDFRHWNIVALLRQMPNYTLTARPSLTPDPDIYRNSLAFVVDSLTRGAVHSCQFIKGGNTQCDLLYQNSNGYLFRITAAGKDLNSFLVTEVALVNGEPAFAAYTSQELAYEVQAKKVAALYNTDKGAYRRAMWKLHNNSEDTLVRYAVALDDSNYSKGFCDQYVAMAYMYAVGNYSDTVKANMLDQMSTVTFRAGCVKLEYR